MGPGRRRRPPGLVALAARELGIALRDLGRRLLALVLTAWCLLLLALPALAAGARQLMGVVAGWAWDTVTRAAWRQLAGQLPTAPEDPFLQMLAAATNSTAPPQAVSLLQGALAGPVEAQALGSAWTWSCLAFAAWRRQQRR